MRVLVVDDELGIREGCRRALTSSGLEVEVAENGPDGLDKLRQGSFDVLLVDAMMPGMSGLEMMQQVRKIAPDIISIIITGYATIELAVQAIREGAHDFIAKPFTHELLMHVINREMDRQRLNREAQRVNELEEKLLGLARVKAETEKIGTMQGRFMMTMVHTLRAPVAVVQNTIQLIRKGYVPPSEQVAFLQQVEERAGELLAILDDLLLLSRLKENIGGAKTETVHLADMAEGALAAFKKEFAEHGLTVSVERMDHTLISGSREYLQALWMHLLGNAIRYTPPGGQITLSLQENTIEKRIIGTVTDTGIGITTEEIPRIFEEFYRTEGARAMQETGTGLGLCIVQQIVSLYGGALEIDSNPGLGSSFRFILPQTATMTGAG
ncbi:MAG: hybrid sensor histidine kinase/response regulator [Syntrophobacterales bacterium]|nr:hybrid sensor histidine kinase/response regulator [Syntrophobacterales bacterium]